jgi:hypothetical protein
MGVIMVAIMARGRFLGVLFRRDHAIMVIMAVLTIWTPMITMITMIATVQN